MNQANGSGKPRNNRFHSKQGAVRTMHKPNTVTHNSQTNSKSSSHHPHKTNSSISRGSRGSYQYGSNKGGRRPKPQAQPENTTQVIQRRKTSYKRSRELFQI